MATCSWLVLLFLVWPAVAGAFQAEVIKIADGDTVTVLRDQVQIRVRLAEIDAPEKKQPFGERSRQALAALCFRQMAEVTPASTDRYGRTVARLKCRGEDAGTAQVRAGLAWVYLRYSRDPALPAIEAEARAARRGLWVDPAPVPPWEWRREPKQ